uniref:Uncharacterized protein n=1 Tax=Arundo donax TaxID=35708 RepID=A0A0A8Z4Y1_ARUDO
MNNQSLLRNKSFCGFIIDVSLRSD